MAIVPFGKYKGQPVEVLANDGQHNCAQQNTRHIQPKAIFSV
jgi:hypothetical protein